MRRSIFYPAFVKVSAALLIFVFFYTALSKFNNLALFNFAISKSPLLKNISGFVVWTLPTVEVLVSLLLVFPGSRETGLQLSFGLLSVFTIYISYMLLFFNTLPCSCGGVIRQMSWSQHLLFNTFLLLVTLLSILFINKPNYPKTQGMPKTCRKE